MATAKFVSLGSSSFWEEAFTSWTCTTWKTFFMAPALFPSALSRRAMMAAFTARSIGPIKAAVRIPLAWNCAAAVPFNRPLGSTRMPSSSFCMTWELRYASVSGVGCSTTWTTSGLSCALDLPSLSAFSTAPPTPPTSSTMAILVEFRDVPPERRMEITRIAIESNGSAKVPRTNALVRTRVMYSRLKISQILRIALRNFFDKDIVQRRFNQLKAVDPNAALDGALQNLLCIGPGAQFDVNHLPVRVDSLNDVRKLKESLVADKFHPDRVVAIRLLDGFQVSVQKLLSFVHQADGITHLLYLVHAVCREDDGCALIAEFQHHVLDEGGVDRIEPGEGFIQDHQPRPVNDGRNKLNFLLHAA